MIMPFWRYLFARTPPLDRTSALETYWLVQSFKTRWQHFCACRNTLRWAFFRSNLNVALGSVLLAACVLTVFGILGLHAHGKHTVQRVGRSLAYAVKSELIEHDNPGIQEALLSIVSEEKIAKANIYASNGQLLAHYQRPKQALDMAWLIGGDYIQPIVDEGTLLGEVHLRRHADVLPHFLLAAAASTGFILLLTALGALYLSRRTVIKVLDPLEQMIDVTRSIRHERNFARRVPPARLAEFNALSEDFNALLDQLQCWQSRLEQENAQLAHQASHDALTGLPNRAFFQGRLQRTLSQAQRQGERAALMFMDCDYFKQINDHFGHSAGDEVLVNIAARIRGQLRQNDLVARLSGDEFAVLIYPAPDNSTLLRIADDILAGMVLPVVLADGRQIKASLSIGVAFYPDHGHSALELLNQADVTMYRVKRGQRGQRLLAVYPNETA